MKNIKTILIMIAVVLGAVVALSVIGMIITLAQYLFWLGVIGAAGFAAIKLFGKSDSRRLADKTPADRLENVRRELEEYKQNSLLK